MLARILYYREKEMPWEIVVPANDVEKAERIAKEKMSEFDAIAYEVELIACSSPPPTSISTSLVCPFSRTHALSPSTSEKID